jgi:hypothetical protein
MLWWGMTRYPVSYANRGGFADTRVAIFGHWKAETPSPLQCRGIAAHTGMVHGAGQCFEKFMPIRLTSA